VDTGAQTRADSAWRPGSRLARVHATHSYGLVLLLVVATFLFVAAAPDSAWASSVLLVFQALTFAVALWTSGLARADSKRSIGVVAVATALAVSSPFVDRVEMEAAVGLATALLTLTTVAVIADGVAAQTEVNGRSVVGAIAIYISLGLFFVYVYGAVAALGSGPLFAQGTDGTRPIRLYFSYVTLATVGYGDYTPSGNFGRSLAVVEALTGQLYLVTVLAILVSRLGRTELRRRGRSRGD